MNMIVQYFPAAAAAVTSGHYTDNKAPRYTRLHNTSPKS